MKKLSKATYNRLDREVYRIHMEYGITSFPVDEKRLAKEMGFGLVPYSSLPEDKRKTMLTSSKPVPIVVIKAKVILGSRLSITTILNPEGQN